MSRNPPSPARLGLLLLLIPAACAAPQAPPPAPVRPVVVPTPAPMNRASVSSVMGQTAPRLQAMLGRPSLDVAEGYARKLQFANASCVLDVYLYPPSAGREGVVTHVDARLPDGRDYDAGACIAALTPQPQTP